MAHQNIDQRQQAVKEMMKSKYSGEDMHKIAKDFGTTYNAVYMDIIYYTYLKSDSPTRNISKHLRVKILNRDNYTCQYCGCKDVIMIAEHVIPYVKGGVGRDYNVVSACTPCNSKKRSKVIIPNNIEVLKELNTEWHDKIIKLADRHCYTYSNWIEFKKHHGLTNKKIAEIIGTSEQNIKVMANRNKPLSTWMKAFLYSWVNEPNGVKYLIQQSEPKKLSIWGKEITEIPINKNDLVKYYTKEFKK
jgi:hypothetical protein